MWWTSRNVSLRGSKLTFVHREAGLGAESALVERQQRWHIGRRLGGEAGNLRLCHLCRRVAKQVQAEAGERLIEASDEAKQAAQALRVLVFRPERAEPEARHRRID